MRQHFLKRAIPNEQFQMILEFVGAEYRIFDVSVLYQEKGWDKLAYPQHMKCFTVSENEIFWPDGGKVDANFLYERSTPIDLDRLENQVLRLSYKNQAPTTEDKNHHVYGVFLAPFSKSPFRVGESIGGGFAERGGSNDLSLSELLAWAEWRQHFKLSGCAWAITLIESLASESEQLFEQLIREACKRNGAAEDD